MHCFSSMSVRSAASSSLVRASSGKKPPSWGQVGLVAASDSKARHSMRPAPIGSTPVQVTVVISCSFCPLPPLVFAVRPWLRLEGADCEEIPAHPPSYRGAAPLRRSEHGRRRHARSSSMPSSVARREQFRGCTSPSPSSTTASRRAALATSRPVCVCARSSCREHLCEATRSSPRPAISHGPVRPRQTDHPRQAPQPRRSSAASGGRTRHCSMRAETKLRACSRRGASTVQSEVQKQKGRHFCRPGGCAGRI